MVVKVHMTPVATRSMYDITNDTAKWGKLHEDEFVCKCADQGPKQGLTMWHGHVLSPLTPWLGRKGVSCPADCNVRSRCCPKMSDELEKVQEAIKEFQEQVEKKRDRGGRRPVRTSAMWTS